MNTSMPAPIVDLAFQPVVVEGVCVTGKYGVQLKASSIMYARSVKFPNQVNSNFLRRSNVVIHVSLKQTEQCMRRDTLIGRPAPDINNNPMKMASSRETVSVLPQRGNHATRQNFGVLDG